MHYLVFIAGIFLSASSFANKIQTHTVVKFPKFSEDCSREKIQIGAAFAQYTGIDVYKLRARIVEKLCNIEIFYQAEETLRVETLNPPESDVYDVDMWNFKNLEECNAKVHSLAQTFYEQTGLKPFLRYCYPKSYPDWAVYVTKGYVPQVYGFGKSKKSYEIYRFAPAYAQDWERVSRQLTQKIESLGGHILYVSRGTEKYSTNAIMYYTTDWIRISTLENKFFHPSREVCEVQLQNYRDLFMANGSTVFSLWCRGNKPEDINHHSIEGAFSGPWLWTEYFEGEIFKKYEHCLEELDNIKHYYEEVLKVPLLGAQCVWRFSRAKVLVFKKRD